MKIRCKHSDSTSLEREGWIITSINMDGTVEMYRPPENPLPSTREVERKAVADWSQSPKGSQWLREAAIGMIPADHPNRDDLRRRIDLGDLQIGPPELGSKWYAAVKTAALNKERRRLEDRLRKDEQVLLECLRVIS